MEDAPTPWDISHTWDTQQNLLALHLLFQSSKCLVSETQGKGKQVQLNSDCFGVFSCTCRCTLETHYLVKVYCWKINASWRTSPSPMTPLTLGMFCHLHCTCSPSLSAGSPLSFTLAMLLLSFYIHDSVLSTRHIGQVYLNLMEVISKVP